MIEMMVAIVLAIVVTDAAVSLFVANGATSQTTAAISAVGDNGRFALSFLEEAIRGGGYMACNATNNLHIVPAPGTTHTAQISVIPPAPASVFTILNNYTQAFSGFEAANSGPLGAVALQAPPVAGTNNGGNWIAPGLDAVVVNPPAPPNGPGTVTPGSDVLVVREVLPQSANLYVGGAGYVHGSVAVPILNTAPIAAIATPANAVISNCTTSVAFQILGIGAGTVTTNADLTIDFDPYSSVALTDTAAYFVAPGRDQDSALWVYHDSTNTYQELVPDIENMQVLYGVAPNTPTLATQYITADQIPPTTVDFNQVVSVKIAVLAANPPQSGNAVATPPAAKVYQLLGTQVTAPLDARMRQVFEETITARDATQ